MESPDPPLLADCAEPSAVVDLREVPLARLGADSDARRMTDRILADAAGRSLIAAVSFNSAI